MKVSSKIKKICRKLTGESYRRCSIKEAVLKFATLLKVNSNTDDFL